MTDETQTLAAGKALGLSGFSSRLNAFLHRRLSLSCHLYKVPVRRLRETRKCPRIWRVS